MNYQLTLKLKLNTNKEELFFIACAIPGPVLA
jgi:hypothetical protein